MLRLAKLHVRRNSPFWDELGMAEWNKHSMSVTLTLAGFIYATRGAYDE